MNVYGHAREDRLANAVERVAEVVLPVKRVPVEYQQAVGAETKIATPLKTEDCDNKNGGGGGNRTHIQLILAPLITTQKRHKTVPNLCDTKR